MGYLERWGLTSLFIWRSVQAIKTFSLSYLLTSVSREYDSIFKQLAVLESEEISSVTGCLKPCHYKKYILLGERSSTSFKSEHYIFSLWAVSSKTRVETEELIYPMSTLVAEFGGTLGLFLGFSFISVWDNFSTLKKCIVFFKSKSWLPISFEYWTNIDYLLYLNVCLFLFYDQRKRMCNILKVMCQSLIPISPPKCLHWLSLQLMY